MTIQLAEAIIVQTGAAIVMQHRFAFDTGTILRLDNDALVNVFDDGRYYIQGENTAELVQAFGRVEAPWDPKKWTGEAPRPTAKAGATEPIGEKGLPAVEEKERFEF